MSKKLNIIKIKDRYFLIQSELKLSNKINLIGFWSVDGKVWGKHVSSVDLTTEEYEKIKQP